MSSCSYIYLLESVRFFFCAGQGPNVAPNFAVMEQSLLLSPFSTSNLMRMIMKSQVCTPDFGAFDIQKHCLQVEQSVGHEA